jgi:predicted RND superfamily exporter protein
VFGARRAILWAFFVLTALFAVIAARGLHIDTRFTKQLPLQHPYMQTYLAHYDEFGGANRVLIALMAREGTIYTPGFFAALKVANDEVFFIPGIDRARVQSLWTPNTRFSEVVEGGIRAGDVIPSGFKPTPEGLAQVRENVLKANVVGRLVANDFTGAIVSAQLLEKDPATGKPVDLIAIGNALEAVRSHLERGDPRLGIAPHQIDVRVIGYSKVVSDIAAGALSVVLFAIVTVVLTLLLVWFYIQSLKIAVVPVLCSLVAVIWQLGILVVLGYGVDPLGILVPFVIFAIGVSHGVQKISAVGDAAMDGADALEAARRTFRLLFVPAIVALLADLMGFVTILAIPVGVIREMAVTASIGVGVVILTDLVLLPIVVSYVRPGSGYAMRVHARQASLARVWAGLSRIAGPRPATIAVIAAVAVGVIGYAVGRHTPIGDTMAGVPELRPQSRYNIDTDIITRKFSIGTDVLNVIAETPANGCVNHDVMSYIDTFAYRMANVEGVRNVMSLPGVAKVISAGWSEGSLKWRNLPRDQRSLVQAQGFIDTSTGLLNGDCSVMPVMLFLADHRAETIDRVIRAVQEYLPPRAVPSVKLRLASGNVGVMAAQIEEVRAKEFPILFGLFAVIAVMCLLTFRSWVGTVVVMLPLMLVSILAYTTMAVVGIGLKVTTLPMVALGAGIGVDYGIYLYSRMQSALAEGASVGEAYHRALRVTGASVFFTGITLALGVATWVFSPLQFQADVGLMLTFMFIVNMLAAMILIPVFAYWLVRPTKKAP